MRGNLKVVGMRKNLIYDVGLHKGKDTDFYSQKGFFVVGIEANPILVANAKIRFKDEIESGRLKIIEGAVAPASVGRNVVLYVNTALTVWGTIDAKWASRNEAFGSSNARTEVNRIEMTEVYRSLGIPFYLKVDIEGVDRFVLKS